MPDPNSVSWQMHADPTMWIAGIASLYLQALHPRAVAGVVQNSNFQADPLGRLKRTADFVGLGVYGTDEEIATAAARVRATHRSLRGVVHGETFRVDEPDLLLWVHCSEVYCFETVLSRAGYGLTDRQKDRYYAEQRFAATLVGLHEDEVPGSRREMAEYFDRMLPDLRRTADSEVIYEFLHGPPVKGWTRHGLPVYRVLVGHLAYSVLPELGDRTARSRAVRARHAMAANDAPSCAFGAGQDPQDGTAGPHQKGHRASRQACDTE